MTKKKKSLATPTIPRTLTCKKMMMARRWAVTMKVIRCYKK